MENPDQDWPLPLPGGCRCGAVRYAVSAPPLFVMACHCTDCRQLTASAFSLGMPVPADGFAVTAGEAQPWTKTADSGHRSTAWRCSACGTWTHTTLDAKPEMVVVRPSTLDDSGWVRPVAEIFTGSALPWARLGLSLAYEREFEDPEPVRDQFVREQVRP
jgi:hypothetical protein